MKNLRLQFAETMQEVAETDKNLIVLVGDISHGILQPLSKKYPSQYHNIGICEPAIMNISAGLAKVGFTPVVHTIAPFITERAYEQIKLDFGYQRLGVNIISVGGAFDYSKLGCSHHCYSDVSIMGHFEEANIFMPGSAKEFDEIFKKNYQNKKINYYKLTEYPHNVELESFEVGSGLKIIEGHDVTLVALGSQLKNALIAAKKLNSQGVSVELLYFNSIKPFDSTLLKSSVEKTRKFVVVEELSSHDGLFNICIRSVAGIDSLQFRQLAIHGFIRGYGTYEDLCVKAGLTAENIEINVLDIMGIASNEE
jgi:transketolase